MDNRIGTLNEDGSVAEWPEADLTGQPYQRPISIVALGEGHFGVFKGGFPNEETVNELKSMLVKPASKKKAKGENEATDV